MPASTETTTYFTISYEGKRTDMWYECGAEFDTLDEAKKYIAEMREDYPNWHAFEVTKHVVTEVSETVYSEE